MWVQEGKYRHMVHVYSPQNYIWINITMHAVQELFVVVSLQSSVMSTLTCSACNFYRHVYMYVPSLITLLNRNPTASSTDDGGQAQRSPKITNTKLRYYQ